MIATTLEQSKRLLEAGYTPETSDMMYGYINPDTGKRTLLAANICHYWNPETHETYFIPAWSLSALWDIFVKSGIVLNFETDETTSSEVLIDMLVQNLVNAAEGKVNLEINEEFLKK